MAQNRPESTRSKEAVQKQSPVLQRQFADAGLQWGSRIYLRLFKTEMSLELWVEDQEQFKLFRSYPICTYGFGGLGPKLIEGDGMAPEGFYFLTPQSMNPNSQYHLSVNLGFPNRFDRSQNRTGSALMIHGSCVSVGCFAMTDEKIEEIYTLIDAAFEQGQKFIRVHSFPFRMTDENMSQNADSEWIEFWQNLKTGYDWFEQNHNQPPNVEVRNGSYVFDQAE